MTEDRLNLLTVKGLISELHPDQAEACNKLAENLRQTLNQAEEPVRTLALTLIGIEAQLAASE